MSNLQLLFDAHMNSKASFTTYLQGSDFVDKPFDNKLLLF